MSQFVCPKCDFPVILPPDHYPNGDPVGGGTGYVYKCVPCNKLWLRDEMEYDDAQPGSEDSTLVHDICKAPLTFETGSLFWCETCGTFVNREYAVRAEDVLGGIYEAN